MSTKRNWRTEPGFRKVDKSSLFFQQEDLLSDEEISVRKISEFGNATEFGNAFPILATFPNSGTLLIFFGSFQIQQ